MLNPVPDLSECAREPIHVPGGIQPHGALLSCDEGLTVMQASANLAEHTGLDAAQARGRSLAEVLGATAAETIFRAREEGGGDQPVGRAVEVEGRRLYVRIHRHQNATLVELEPGGAPGREFSVLSDTLARIQGTATLPDLLRKAADEVRALTGFERVMLYRFAEDGSGHVVAESRIEELEPYLDLHYPASDIPAQARRLYLLNRLRLIPEARHTPVPIEPARRPDTGEPLDLSYAELRAVSPVHLEYMGNMGVRASMSISIIVRGQLWGLITCGNRTPLLPSHGMRSACELIGRLTSLQIAALSEMGEAAERSERAVQTRALVETTKGSAEGLRGLRQQPERLLRLVDAGGVALFTRGEWTCFGRVPPSEALTEIAAWLGVREPAEVFHSHCLSRELPAAKAFADVASGLLAISMPQPLDERVLWFRPQVIQTVKWGGDPDKPAESASGRLRPRRSFELWKQTVGATSLPWQKGVIDAAADLRRHCIELDLTLQVARANAAVQARDDMVAVVSHDLRNPISMVQMAASTIWL